MIQKRFIIPLGGFKAISPTILKQSSMTEISSTFAGRSLRTRLRRVVWTLVTRKEKLIWFTTITMDITAPFCPPCVVIVLCIYCRILTRMKWMDNFFWRIWYSRKSTPRCCLYILQIVHHLIWCLSVVYGARKISFFQPWDLFAFPPNNLLLRLHQRI